MAADITGELNSRDLKEFGKDFGEVMRVYSGINKEYAMPGKETDRYIDRFRDGLKKFNKKYKNLVINLRATTEKLNLSIFIKDGGVKEVFANVASKLNGLKAVGLKDFGEVKVEEPEFSDVIEKVKDRLFISYVEQSESSVYLEQRKDMVELHADEDIGNPSSPGFKILGYYAVKDMGKCDVYSILSGIGFMERPILDKVRSMLKKFNPRIGE